MSRENPTKKAPAAKKSPSPAVQSAEHGQPAGPLPLAAEQAHPDVATIMRWQQTVGNRAVERTIRRRMGQPAGIQRDPVDPSLNLTSARFAGDSRLQAAYDNAPAMAQGESGDPVKKVQEALVADGFVMPGSTTDEGELDGIFGSETRQVVLGFQNKHSLSMKDGVVGRETLGQLDTLAGPTPQPDNPQPDNPQPDAPTSAEEIYNLINGLSLAARRSLRASPTFIPNCDAFMTTAEFAKLAALLTVDCPTGVSDPAAAHAEAIRIVETQLMNKDIAKASMANNVEVVIIPKSMLMTDVPQFASMRGTQTFDGRDWETVRGSGGLTIDGFVYTAVTEENLLGVDCTAQHNGVTISGTYDAGYSTTSHEFAHALHIHVLEDADKTIITDAYNARKALATAAPTDSNQWVDGREGCYASQTEHEFFAQLSNAYLGTNAGNDPYVNEPRHNGKDWVENNEPTIFAILERMYAGGELQNTNPRP